MAIFRLASSCRSCEQALLLRIGVAPAPEMRIRCQCPHCGVALRIRLETRDPEDVRFTSEDVVLIEAPADERELPVLILYTDLPVHRSLLGHPQEGIVSGFLFWVALWGDRAAEYTQRSHQLQAMREHRFPDIRRAASLYGADDRPRLPDAVARLGLADAIPELAQFDPIYQLGRAVDIFHLPFVDLAARTLAANELLTYMVACHRDHREPYRRLLDQYVDDLGFIEHRRKVIETAMTVLDHIDALLPGLAWEHISVDPPPEPEEFRIVRDDFNELRARYVDIFEVASRTLAYIGAITNLARRGRPTTWSNGSTAQIRGMLRRHASKREFILDDLPLARPFYEAVNRHSRNTFGHYGVEYDFADGELVDRDGRRTSFVLFMRDYLAAARMTAYLLTVVEKLSLDYLDAESFHRQVARDAEAGQA